MDSMRRRCLEVIEKGILPTLSLLAYLIAWTANGEFLQGINTGSLCPGGVPYNKPTFLTWFDYNFMTLSFLVVFVYVRFYRKWTVLYYVRDVWTGEVRGILKLVLACALMNYASILVNTLYIIGLECISVALGNAICQLQAAFTVGFAVFLLGDQFLLIQMIGIGASFVGVALLVVPPLFYDAHLFVVDDEGSEKNCSSVSTSIASIFALLISALIWGGYQISWRVLMEFKFPSGNTQTRLEGLIDTLMTAGVIGLCNMLLGWPFVLVAHYVGFETFELPSTTYWPILLVNALVEFSFDITCVIAIYLTSPVIVAVTGPLVIPMGIAADQIIHGAHIPIDAWVWSGIVMILVGVAAIEMKFDTDDDLSFVLSLLSAENLSSRNDETLLSRQTPDDKTPLLPTQSPRITSTLYNGSNGTNDDSDSPI